MINLDQKKAFDNVDHGYLFNTMRAMGFGARFISYLQIIYGYAESLVKVCSSLTVPFSFEKGIRQGCPLSGLLYTIAIEPLLNNLRSNTRFHLPSTEFSCAVSAYADDVTIFVTSDSGFKEVEEAYSLFSRASAARLNTQKSQGLWAGSWIGRNDKPLIILFIVRGFPF